MCSTLLCLLLAAAAGSALQVPFITQKPNACGPAALAMVAGYHGRNITQDEIATAIQQPGIRGVLTTDLAAHAQRLGFWSRAYRSDFGDLQRKLANGVPLIVNGRFGSHDHFFVVVATDKFSDTVTVHTDSRPNLEMRREEFLRFWERGGRWALLVCPPDKADWRLSADEHNDLGLFLERINQLMAAAGHYRMAAELQPHVALYQINLGNALLKQRLLAEAATAYRQAVKLAPEDANALNNLAWAWHELDANLDEAVALCHRAVALQPSRRAYYLDTLGCVLRKQGKKPEARAAFESALAAVTARQASLRETIEAHLASVKD